MSAIIKTRMINIGSSVGISIPKSVIEQLGLQEMVALEIFPNQLVIRSIDAPRQGWSDQFKAMAEAGDDLLLDGDAVALTAWDEAEWQWL